jgi:putative component of membrane protein insertase Oxa1/YidC/SpoIIIJ protein YidD
MLYSKNNEVKYFILFTIKFYWFIIPPHKRNKCLFKESCSRFVYRNTKNLGLVEGLKALNHRIRSCKPGYFIVEIDGEIGIIARDKQFYKKNQLRDNLI